MFLRLLFKNIKYTFVLNKLYKKQSAEYEILQLSHRIEKGLTIQPKKKEWGREKAENLISKLEILSSDSELNRSIRFSIEIGCAVLAKYILQKKQDNEFNEKIETIEKRLNAINMAIDFSSGGILPYKKRDFEATASFLDIIENRHSVRNFS